MRPLVERDVICLWCGEIVREGLGVEDSNGVCDQCREKIRKEAVEYERQQLESCGK